MENKERRKRIIGVDFDDVIIDWNTALVAHYNSIHGTSHKREDILSYDLEKLWGGSKERAVRTVFDFYGSDQHAHIEPMPEALECISRLGSYELVVITSRPESARATTEAWLRKNIPGLHERIYFTNQYHGKESEKRDKASICKELGVDIFIDDAIHNAENIITAGIPVLLLDSPWNQTDTLPPLITRVFSWQEIVEKILDDTSLLR